jgi:hypothetical protein
MHVRGLGGLIDEVFGIISFTLTAEHAGGAYEVASYGSAQGVHPIRSGACSIRVMNRRKEDIDGWMYKSHRDDHLQGERVLRCTDTTGAKHLTYAWVYRTRARWTAE